MKDLEGTAFVYFHELDSNLANLGHRVETMRANGKLGPEALIQIRKYFRIKNIYNSNAIEGNSLNLGETREVIENGVTISGKSLKDQAEAKNLREAIDYLENLVTNNVLPITEFDIRQLHYLVLKDSNPENAGKYRTNEVIISGSSFKPPESFLIPTQMSDYGKWLSQLDFSNAIGSEKALLWAAAAHTWFVMIHPFSDGNGRTARLLLNLILMRCGFPIAIITKDDRLRYYDALETAQSSDLTPFINLLIECVNESLEEYEEAVNRQVAQQEWAKSITDRFNKNDLLKAHAKYEVWKSAMDLLKSTFRQTMGLLAQSSKFIKMYFNDFGWLDFEKYVALSTGASAKKTWFFRVDFKKENRTARYLFFFGSPSAYFQNKDAQVSIHIAREQPENSFNYSTLDKIDECNILNCFEIAYSPQEERFISHGATETIVPDRAEKLAQFFFEEILAKHFSNC